MKLQPVTSQLYIVNGALQDGTEVPGLLAQAAPAKSARGRSHDTLFIHLSLGGDASTTSSLAQDLLEAVALRFFATPGSVTAALRGAILAANELLLRLNMSGTGPAREGAVSCAVLRGQELFLVQAGVSYALIGRNFGVERLPARLPNRTAPLGRSAGLDLRYFHNWLEPGDMLLLADESVTDIPSETMKPVLVDTTVEDSLPHLVDIVGDRSASVLLIEFADETTIDLPDTATGLKVHETPAPPSRSPRPAATPRPKTGPAQGAGPARTAGPTQGAQPAAGPGTAGSAGARSSFDLPSAVQVEDTARRAGAQTARGLSRATGWLADLMHRLRPPNPRRQSEETGGWTFPLLAAILIPILLAVIVGGAYIQRGRVTRFSELRRDMQTSLMLATESASAEEQLAHYMQVLRLAAAAEGLRPGNDEVNRMRGQALEALDRLEDVTRLQARQLYEYSEDIRLGGIVLREGLNGDLYTLDRANNSIYVHETEEDYTTFVSEEPERIIFDAQVIGTHIVGPLVDMAWRPRGVQVTADGLVVLDSRGALLSYRPTFADLRAVPLGLASEWLEPVAIAQFNERLYVLDRGAGQLWRYFPESDGFYVDEAQRTLSLPDLKQAVDAAIYSEDASVIVLYGDGRVRRYGQDSLLWDETTLYQNGLDTPLVAPTRIKIIGRGLNSSVFIADPGSGRIVQLSLGGTFLAQWKAVEPRTGEELFAQMSDFDVADSPLRIFVTAGNRLYVAAQP
ncbi:MAG: hypothetical protein RRC07_01845 [Anaerolineae bacterium]|nr:hypothetical protein [Anaerolineae bacterium]